MQCLRRNILENDRVQRFIPAENQSGRSQNYNIDAQNDIERIHTLFLGKVDCDKIRAAAGGIYRKAHTDRDTVDDAAEDTDQQCVVSEGIRRQQIDEKAV